MPPQMGPPMTPRLRFVVATALVSYVLYGYDTGVVSGAALMVKDDFKLDTMQQGMVVTSTNLFAMFSAALGGPLGDWLGRRPIMVTAALLYLAGPLVSATTQRFEMLLVGRMLLGCGVGFSFVSVPTYIAECAPQDIRGILVDLADFVVVFGQLFAGLVNGFLESVEEGWRWSIGGAAILAFAQLLMLCTLPESPRWLIEYGDPVKAEEIMRALRVSSESDEAARAAVEVEVEEIRLSVAKEHTATGCSAWCRRRVFRALVLGFGLQALNQLTGINTVMYFGATILESAGFQKNVAIWLACLCDFAQLVGVGIGLWNIDLRGRRFTGITSCASVVVTLFFLGLAFAVGDALNWLCVVALMLYLVSFGAGLSGVPYVVNSEIYPLEVRVRGNAVAGVSNWGFNYLVSSTFPLFIEADIVHMAFWIYAAIGAGGCAWLWFYLPETAHLSLEEIDDCFQDPYPKDWAASGIFSLRQRRPGGPSCCADGTTDSESEGSDSESKSVEDE